MHDDDDATVSPSGADEPRARDVVRAQQTLARAIVGTSVVESLLRREQRRPAGNGARTWRRVAGEDPFVIARLEGDIVRATTYVDGRFVRIDQEAREAARQRHGGVPTPPSSWTGGGSSAEASIPAAFRNIPVATRSEGDRAANQGESLIPAGFRDLPIAKPKEHAPSAAEVAAKRRAAEASQAKATPAIPAGSVPVTPTAPTTPTAVTPRPAHSATGRAMLSPRARTPIAPTVRPTPGPTPPPVGEPAPTRPPAPAPSPAPPTASTPVTSAAAIAGPPPSVDADSAARQAQRGAGGSLDDLFQRPAAGTEGRTRLARRPPPPTDPTNKPSG
ncbi:MAG: hypothetical protein RLZZ383_1930 [Pseudomonadota bacterium]|jgi:hypothetical protein